MLTDKFNFCLTNIMFHFIYINYTTAPGSFRDGDIRLVGSSKNWEGQVEVYLSGTWGSVGDSSWTDEDAQVVCRQLGHSEQGEDCACFT